MSEVISHKTYSIETSAIEFNVAYVTPSSVDYVEVYPIQITNDTASNDANMTVRWVDYSDRVYVSSTYWGDGTTIKQNYYSYPAHPFVSQTLLPAGAGLSVLDNKFTMQPNDLIQFKSDPGIAGVISVSVIEYYPEGYTPESNALQYSSRQRIQGILGPGKADGADYAPVWR